MTKFKILNRWTGETICELDAESLGGAVEKAVESGASLDGANLTGANLDGANLDGASLAGANLTGANLDGANLTGASLAGASLDGANLTRANLDGASLDGASLTGANLTRANLTGANLDGANLDGASLAGASLAGASLDGASLDGANLTGASLARASLAGASLTPIRDDLWAVLSAAPKEVAGLRLALIEGRIDGTQYGGKCACLVGTIANVRSCDYHDLGLLKPNSDRPSERFFLGIHNGDKPETNQFSKLALEWIDTWLANMREAFGPAPKEAL